jgi:hypothetical protein
LSTISIVSEGDIPGSEIINIYKIIPPSPLEKDRYRRHINLTNGAKNTKIGP